MISLGKIRKAIEPIAQICLIVCIFDIMIFYPQVPIWLRGFIFAGLLIEYPIFKKGEKK